MGRKQQTVLITIGANALLILLRFVLAYVSGSLALQANAWHSLGDIFVLGVVFLGLMIAAQKDERFREVIARVENVVSLVVAVFIAYMGYALFTDVVGGETVEIKYVVPASIGAFLGVCITYFMGRYMLYVGKQENSASLIAGGFHAKMDMVCSGAVLVGLIGEAVGASGLDKSVTVLVVVLIWHVALFEIFLPNLRALRAERAEIPAAHEHAHGPGRAAAVIVLMVIAFALAYMGSGIYRVGTDEVAIVRRFGSITEARVQPGLHYRWPYPIERVEKVKVATARRVETGFRVLLSGDTNLVNVNIAIHYKVADPVKYQLRTAEPDTLVTNAARAGIRRVVGVRGIDDILTTRKADVEEATRKFIQARLDGSGAGVEVIGVRLLALAPPEDVIEAFRDVASAREDKVTYVNQALSYRNSLVPKARGEAATMLREAEAYQLEKVQRATGEADRFVRKLAAFKSARHVTRLRLYLETVEKVLPGVKKFLVSGEVDVESTDLWLVGEDVKGILLGE